MDKSADKPYALFMVSLENGEKRRLTSPPAGTFGDRYGSISPDGRTILFVRIPTSGLANSGDIYALSLTTDFAVKGEPRRLTFDNAGVGGLAWTADSREIVFSSGIGGSASLWRMPVSGPEKPTRLTVGENATSLAISPRSNRLVYEQTIPVDVNIWRLDLFNPVAPPTPFITSTRTDESAHYSPDGKRIVFRSARSGPDEIWACDADGSNAAQLTHTGEAGSPHWSPDGGRITFDATVDGHW
jgi:Tol biopolymer transport system component